MVWVIWRSLVARLWECILPAKGRQGGSIAGVIPIWLDSNHGAEKKDDV